MAGREIELLPGEPPLVVNEFSCLQDEAGAVVWDAALVLVHYLAHVDAQQQEQQQQGQGPQDGEREQEGVQRRLQLVEQQDGSGRGGVRGRVVVDVGSGTGVVGLAAARLGAAHCALTDLPHLVPYLRENIQANGSAVGAVCSAHTLRWGEASDLAALLAQLPGGRQPDVVLASDVVYQVDTLDVLCGTLAALCGPHTACCLLAFELRPGFSCERVEGALGRQGLVARQVLQREMHPDWRSDDIVILELSKAVSAPNTTTTTTQQQQPAAPRQPHQHQQLQ